MASSFTSHTPPAPISCRFAVADRRVEIPLIWSAEPSDVVRQKQLALAKLASRPPGVESLDSGRAIWIDIPTFAADEEHQAALLGDLRDSLAAALKARPKWRLLVLDLRGADTGRSQWGDEIARLLFGKKWVQQADAWLNDGLYAEWRVSPFNVRALWGMLTEIERRQGAESADARRMRLVVDSMFVALERGDSLYGQRQSRRGVCLRVRPGVPRPRGLDGSRGGGRRRAGRELHDRGAELDGRGVIERGDDSAGSHKATDADVAKSCAAIEARPNDRVCQSGTGGIHARSIRFHRGFDLIELRRRQCLLRNEFATATILTLTFRERRLGFRQRSARFCTVEFDENRAALYEIPFVEANCSDDVRCLGGDIDRLPGTCRSYRFDERRDAVLHIRPECASGKRILKESHSPVSEETIS